MIPGKSTDGEGPFFFPTDNPTTETSKGLTPITGALPSTIGPCYSTLLTVSVLISCLITPTVLFISVPYYYYD